MSSASLKKLVENAIPAEDVTADARPVAERIADDLQARHESDHVNATTTGAPEEIRPGFFVWPGDPCIYLSAADQESGHGARAWVLRYATTGSKDVYQQAAMLTADDAWRERYRQSVSIGLPIGSFPEDVDPIDGQHA